MVLLLVTPLMLRQLIVLIRKYSDGHVYRLFSDKGRRIIANVHGCVPLSGANRNPQFLLLDYVDIGHAFEAADQLNGLAG
jgi:hypothetical protein